MTSGLAWFVHFIDKTMGDNISSYLYKTDIIYIGTVRKNFNNSINTEWIVLKLEMIHPYMIIDIRRKL